MNAKVKYYERKKTKRERIKDRIRNEIKNLRKESLWVLVMQQSESKHLK